MTPELFEQLLEEEESTTLDFKEAAFVLNNQQGPDPRHGQAKLIKHVLAFANTTRRADAYILLGVRKKPGSRAEIVGVDADIDDAIVQQIVNSKLNRPIVFHYYNFKYEDKRVAVIEIPLGQTRPFYLLNNFEPLRAKETYIRRGSSTDVATPDEIVGFDRVDGSRAHTPLIEVTLFDCLAKKSLGFEQHVDLKPRDYPPQKEILEYSPKKSPLDVYNSFAHLYEPSPNSSYYQEYAIWDGQSSSIAPVSFQITNQSGVTAIDVSVRLKLEDAKKSIFFLKSRELKSKPAKQSPRFVDHFRPPNFNNSLPVPRIGRQEEFLTDSHVHHIELILGKLQPKESFTLDERLYIGTKGAGSVVVNLEGAIYADNIPQPLPVKFRFFIRSDRHKVTSEEFPGICEPIILKSQKEE
jgi:Putative DNA-binding domain